MNTMTTLSEITNLLKDKGYTLDFKLKGNYLECICNLLKIFTGDFIVDKHYRFEGPTDPGDEAIVYAISSPRYNLKGVFVNVYGISNDIISDEMIKVFDEKKN